ncbi:PREDICTED: uncharacterized protein LOC106744658 [Dinoponera quadriceps]|uniref:Uncharacterized protein LOC106744658 n=1 Tax=Dinoponera quadriceps TaxID=609295 RepID=A0A6P3X9L1_DINQU|nr:PREDICTED: uncharacterized protein LOC106744658 [Dinoponera quadriceps]
MAVIYEGNRHLANFDYNQFFHPNVCHVCKSTDQNNLLSCNRCYMISYCTEEHKILHQSHHEDICVLISSVLDEDPDWNTRRLFFHEWIEIQKTFAEIIRMTLTRELMPYEKQMFVFAKSCFICHQRGNLYTCERCISFSYCVDHAELALLHHPTMCELLTLTLKLDIAAIEQKTWQTLQVKFTTFPSKKKRVTNMGTFCNQYFRPQKGDLYWCLYDHIFTDYVSDPLTVHNGLKSANWFRLEETMGIFTVHVIAANYVNRHNFPAWELFLHLLNKNSKLIIVMIGPELQTEFNEHKVCSRCKIARKKLILESFPLLYHHYVSSTSYKPPTLIVGFQAEVHVGVTWSESIIAIQARNCPFLLTAKTETKLLKDMIKMREVLNKSVNSFLNVKNKFFSYRPYRDFETENVSYRNTYLAIFKNLN